MPEQVSARALAVLSVAAMLFWPLTAVFSLVDTTNNTAAAALSLIFAVLHFWTVSLILRGSRSRIRFGLLALALPIVILAIDDIGRISYGLGGPLFRIVI